MKRGFILSTISKDQIDASLDQNFKKTRLTRALKGHGPPQRYVIISKWENLDFFSYPDDDPD